MLTRAQAVAVARIGLGIAATLNSAEMFGLLSRIADGRVARPVVGWMPEVTTFGAWTFVAFALSASVLLILGWHSSQAAALYFGLSVWCFLWDQQTYNSHQMLASLLIGYLAFAGPDAEWAVRPGRPAKRPDATVLMMTQLSACYLFASLSKMTVRFLSGVPLDGWTWPDLPRLVFAAMAVGTVVVELYIAVALWLPRWRPMAFALGAGLHLSIPILMVDQTLPLISFGLTCLCLYPLFWTWQSSLRSEIFDGGPPARSSSRPGA